MRNRSDLTLISCGATILCALGTMLGSAMSWGSAYGIEIAGMDGDGLYTLIAGVVCLVLIISYLSSPDSNMLRRIVGALCLVAFFVAFWIAITDFVELRDLVDESEGIVRVGSGLYLVLTSSFLGVFASLSLPFIPTSTAIE